MSCKCDGPCGPVGPPWYIPPFPAFTEYTSVMPKMYWNVVSQEQRIHRLCETLDKLICYADMLGVKINVNRDDIDWLLDQFNEFKEHGFEDYYEQQLEQWIKDNAALLFTMLAKQVFFGLTMDGHFVAYIPDGWEDIIFDTGMVYGRSDYGRLVLKFNTSGEGAIDNTYSYSLAQEPAVYNQLVADLEIDAQRTDACYDTLFTNLDEDV